MNQNKEFDLIDIIELYNVYNFIRDFGKETAERFGREQDSIIQNFKKKIGIFFSSAKLGDFSKRYQDLPYKYKDDFWTLMLHYDVLKKVVRTNLSFL